MRTDLLSEKDHATAKLWSYPVGNDESYMSEAALTSKQRNEIPDSEFGLPRLRAYPLNDKAHVQQAVRMFGHVKNPKDQKTLANNIVKAAKKHGVDIKVGKKNALYHFLPKAMQESAFEMLLGEASEPSLSERTKEDIIKEHLRTNGEFYNTVFYGPEYVNAVKALREYTFMDFFYPNVTRMEFAARLRCVCGGLGVGEGADDLYPKLGMRKPLDTNFAETPNIGWCKISDDNADSLIALIDSDYMSESNWFRVDLGRDYNHIFFCLKLYSIMGEIFLDPAFNPDFHLDAEHQLLLTDWIQQVQYHYDLYKEAANEQEGLREQQYLWDLFWNFNDNPMDPAVQNANIIAMLRNMASVNNQAVNMNEANIAGELVSKEDCTAYLVHDLGMPDDVYLIPEKLLYPVVNKTSVRLAMDNIRKIEKEYPSDLKTYADNLNKKYKEMGCNFTISTDHPFAKYADKNVVLYMTTTLLEGETAVDDEGTSTGAAPEDRVAAPPHKKVEFIRGQYLKNLADDRLTQPNVKSTRVLKDQDDSLS